MKNLNVTSADGIDPEILAAMRVEAMRPSLEAVGRFDPESARQRFLDSYSAADTWLIHADHVLIGFYVLRQLPDHIYLNHIYIEAAHQGGGAGRRILTTIQDQARAEGLPVRLRALGGSPANDFYASCGFVCDRSDALDNYYIWEPT